MADVPRDPRQLARDILSGKISIEDLAREQARRRSQTVGGPAALPQRPVTLPPGQQARVPAPRPMPPMPPTQAPRRPQGGGSMGGQIPGPISTNESSVPAALPQSAPQRQVPTQRMPTPVSRPPQPLRSRAQLPTATRPVVRAPGSKVPAPVAIPPKPLLVKPAESAMGAATRQADAAASAQAASAAAVVPLAQSIGRSLRNRAIARRAILLSEILQPPLALRQERRI